MALAFARNSSTKDPPGGGIARIAPPIGAEPSAAPPPPLNAARSPGPLWNLPLFWVDSPLGRGIHPPPRGVGRSPLDFFRSSSSIRS
eukprot:399756-Prorocentrum_minimum.AAC.1